MREYRVNVKRGEAGVLGDLGCAGERAAGAAGVILFRLWLLRARVPLRVLRQVFPGVLSPERIRQRR